MAICPPRKSLSLLPPPARPAASDGHNRAHFTAKSLTEAIRQASVHVSAVYCDACLMNAAEYQFELAPLTDYLVLSTFLVPSAGGNYTELVDALSDNPDEPEQALTRFARFCVDAWNKDAEKEDNGEDVPHYHDMSVYRSAEADAFGAAVREDACDCLVGIGGGKALDLTKEVGAQLGLHVFTVPTCAATCAAFAPLSVLYDSEGRMLRNHHHPDEVQGVIVDTAVLAAAPARYLASGMADAMAKSCEYSFLRSELRYGDLELSKYLGYRMALVSDEVLLRIGRQALEDNRNAQVTDALEDAVFCTIASTGIISGMGGFVRPGGSRFAVAHSFNEILRGTYVDTRAWLHGELVGVGILAQHYTNGSPEEHIRHIERFYRDLSLPVCLSDLGLTLDDQAFSVFTEEIVRQSKVPEAQAGRVRLAVAKVR